MSLFNYTAPILKEISAMICDASRSSKSQENGPYHHIVWPGLFVLREDVFVNMSEVLYSNPLVPMEMLDGHLSLPLFGVKNRLIN